MMRHAAIGGIAGFLATMPMSVVMLALHRFLPEEHQFPLAPKQITNTLLRRAGLQRRVDDEERDLTAIASHFSYGASAGSVYAMTAGRVPGSPVISGLIYGLVLWAAGYQGWLPAFRILPSATRFPASRNVVLIASHVTWGASAGAMLRWLERRSG